GQFRISNETEEVTFDGYNIEMRYYEPESWNGARTGSLRAAVGTLDLEGSEVCLDCFGGQNFVELKCKNGSMCWTGFVKVHSNVAEQADINGGNSWSVHCAPSECKALLQALKDATGASSTYISGRKPQTSQNPPDNEPVIDGSQIPKEIDFTKKGDSGASAQTGPPTRVFDSLSAYFKSDDSAIDPRQVSTLGSETSTQASDEKDRRKPLQIDVSGIAEKYGADLFDGLKSNVPKTPMGAWQYVAGEWLTSLFAKLSREQTSYAFTGKSFDELPDTFQKDYSVWDAGLKRIFNPFSVKRGYALVDEYDKLFNLWEAQ
ncbi:MAG TPA: hypothetical protein VMJ34_14495, partial [Bryobacteraceae bacterium]|nr:hypothetical protein [Bryobacteraceae bacterium]